MATEFDITCAAASVYAESLLQLANEAGQADSVAEELADLRALWDRDASFAALMSSAAIEDDARTLSIRKIFGSGRVSELVYKFLMVLNGKRRAMILPAVCDAFRQMIDKQRGRGEVFVTSAVELNDEQRAGIREQIKRLIGLDVVLVERIESDLLGGLRVEVGDHIYDSSVRQRLHAMRAGLLVSLEKHLLGSEAKFVTEG